MHTRISATALHQDMVTVVGPSLRQRGSDDGAAVAKSAKVRMRDHIFEEAVAPALTQEIRSSDQHARGGDAPPFVGHEDVDARPCECLSPHDLRTFADLDRGAHLRRCEQLKKRGQVGGEGETRSDHYAKFPQSEVDVQPERPRHSAGNRARYDAGDRTKVCPTTGVLLRGPERSEGHVSSNGLVGRPPARASDARSR
jgi:hypothetical protein